MVEVTGFEPATPCPPDMCATRLRYTSTSNYPNLDSRNSCPPSPSPTRQTRCALPGCATPRQAIIQIWIQETPVPPLPRQLGRHDVRYQAALHLDKQLSEFGFKKLLSPLSLANSADTMCATRLRYTSTIK